MQMCFIVSAFSHSLSRNLDSQMTDIANEFNDQISVAYDKLVRSRFIERSTLLKIPVAIENVRRRCSQLKEPLTCSAAEIERYWVYMINMWVHNSNRKVKKRNTQR